MKLAPNKAISTSRILESAMKEVAEDINKEIENSFNRFTTKDSGERKEFNSGMVRDTNKGKARFDLLVPNGIPYKDQFLTRLAELMARGAEKYCDRNWELADSEEEMNRAKESAFRHFFQWFCGEVDEDHAMGTIFNMMVYETTKYKLEKK